MPTRFRSTRSSRRDGWRQTAAVTDSAVHPMTKDIDKDKGEILVVNRIQMVLPNMAASFLESGLASHMKNSITWDRILFADAGDVFVISQALKPAKEPVIADSEISSSVSFSVTASASASASCSGSGSVRRRFFARRRSCEMDKNLRRILNRAVKLWTKYRLTRQTPPQGVGWSLPADPDLERPFHDSCSVVGFCGVLPRFSALLLPQVVTFLLKCYHLWKHYKLREER